MPEIKQDAIDMLRADHQHITDLMDEFETLDDPATRQSLAEAAVYEIKVHQHVEEELFYPAMREAVLEPDILDDVETGHEDLDLAIEELERVQPGEMTFHDKFTELGSRFQDHVEESETLLLSQTEDLDVDWDSLGRKMHDRKDDLLKDLPRSFIPRPH